MWVYDHVVPLALEGQYPHVEALSASPYGTPSLVPGKDPHLHPCSCFLCFCVLLVFLPCFTPLSLLVQHMCIPTLAPDAVPVPFAVFMFLFSTTPSLSFSILSGLFQYFDSSHYCSNHSNCSKSTTYLLSLCLPLRSLFILISACTGCSIQKCTLCLHAVLFFQQPFLVAPLWAVPMCCAD